MRVRDLAYETVTALDANRGRSLLTILGIVIGIGAVIAMTALIGGIKESLVTSLGLTQARMVYMSVWTERGVTMDDVERVTVMLPEYEYIAATSYSYADAKSETKTFGASIQGVQPTFFKVMGHNAVEGHFFSERDEESGAFVCVLDQGSVKQLYGRPDESVVGRSIQINNIAFTIVGVIDSEESYMDGGGNIYMPFSTCCKRIAGSNEVSDIRGLVRDGVDMATIAEKTKAVLVNYFGIEESEDEEDYSSGDVYVMTMQSVIDNLNSTLASFQLMMTAVASISLLVGGIGIMNMMLTNVTERIREIGLRKALGARRSDITTQFLLESVCLCVVGGIIGILVGYVGSFALTGVAGGLMESESGTAGPIVPVIDGTSVAMATGICVLIGVLFGYYPARRAAKLDPVESLHYQ